MNRGIREGDGLPGPARRFKRRVTDVRCLGDRAKKLLAAFTRGLRHRTEAGDMHEGTDDYVANDSTVAPASYADMGHPRREDHLIGMRDGVG